MLDITTDFWFGISTIFAVLIGPVLAVWVTRYIDHNRAQKTRKLEEQRLDPKIARDRDTLLTRLLHEMAQVVGVKLQQLDIHYGVYAPKIWNENYRKQLKVQEHLIDVLSGKIPLTIQPAPQAENSPCPPPQQG